MGALPQNYKTIGLQGNKTTYNMFCAATAMATATATAAATAAAFGICQVQRQLAICRYKVRWMWHDRIETLPSGNIVLFDNLLLCMCVSVWVGMGRGCWPNLLRCLCLSKPSEVLRSSFASLSARSGDNKCQRTEKSKRRQSEARQRPRIKL